jgi:23S rRNA pseudouridine2605 synthase
VASRRASEELIAAGRVSVDGRVVRDPARDVDERNEVVADGEQVHAAALEYHAVNKPVGVVSTARDPGGKPTVVELVDSGARLYPVGRLDVNSSGLILLTNDGELANRLMHPRYGVEKAYRAWVRGRPSKSALGKLRSGIELDDGRTAPAKVEVLRTRGRETEVEIVIREGRKRIVRRMLEAAGNPVVSLERIRIGPLELGRLASGMSRRLRPPEVERLTRAARIPPHDGRR